MEILVSKTTTILNLGGVIFECKHRHETFLIELKCKASFPVSVSSQPHPLCVFVLFCKPHSFSWLAMLLHNTSNEDQSCIEQICFRLTSKVTHKTPGRLVFYMNRRSKAVFISQSNSHYLGHRLIGLGTRITITSTTNSQHLHQKSSKLQNTTYSADELRSATVSSLFSHRNIGTNISRKYSVETINQFKHVLTVLAKAKHDAEVAKHVATLIPTCLQD